MSLIKFNQSLKVIALLIGITYKNTSYELTGCDQDALRVKDYLKSVGLVDDQIILMTENESDAELHPSKENIVNQLNKLVDQNNENRLIFFYYSGHGSFLRDASGDEIDGRDELLCPSDFDKNGCISDDYLKENVIDKLPKSSIFFALIDACHSGTILDLKYTYNKIWTVLIKILYDWILEREDLLIFAYLVSKTIIPKIIYYHYRQ